MNAARYLVVVARGGDAPDLATLAAFVASGTQGVSYLPGVWHHPMIALDHEIDFTCLAWEDGTAGDCVVVDRDYAEARAAHGDRGAVSRGLTRRRAAGLIAVLRQVVHGRRVQVLPVAVGVDHAHAGRREVVGAHEQEHSPTFAHSDSPQHPSWSQVLALHGQQSPLTASAWVPSGQRAASPVPTGQVQPFLGMQGGGWQAGSPKHAKMSSSSAGRCSCGP